MAGTRNKVVLFGSTNTSFPTATASILVFLYATTLDWTHVSVYDWLAAAEARCSLGRLTVTEMLDPERAERTEESES